MTGTTDKLFKCACGGNVSIDTPHDTLPTCLCRKCGQFWTEDAWAGLEQLRERLRTQEIIGKMVTIKAQ